MNKTKVIFRYWKGATIALFPELPGTNDSDTCLSYMKESRHNSCTLTEVMKESRFALLSEYESLKTELEHKYDLIPIRLNRQHHKEARIKKINP